MAEDLVPPAGDGLGRRRDQPAQDVADRLGAADLGRPGAVEPARPVVQQRRIGRRTAAATRRVAFVARRTDGVETLAEAAQPPGRQVEVPAGQLGVEELQRERAGQSGVRPHRRERIAAPFRGFERPDGGAKALIELLRGGHRPIFHNHRPRALVDIAAYGRSARFMPTCLPGSRSDNCAHNDSATRQAIATIRGSTSAPTD